MLYFYIPQGPRPNRQSYFDIYIWFPIPFVYKHLMPWVAYCSKKNAAGILTKLAIFLTILVILSVVFKENLLQYRYLFRTNINQIDNWIKIAQCLKFILAHPCLTTHNRLAVICELKLTAQVGWRVRLDGLCQDRKCLGNHDKRVMTHTLVHTTKGLDYNGLRRG